MSRASCHFPHCPCSSHLQDAARAFPWWSSSQLAQEIVLSPAFPLLPPVPEHLGRDKPLSSPLTWPEPGLHADSFIFHFTVLGEEGGCSAFSHTSFQGQGLDG